MALTPQTYIMFAFIPLILWRMYSRIRRMVGRQKLIAWRQNVTVCLFPLLVMLMAFVSLSNPYVLLALAGGLAVGTGLGIFGHRTTKFEHTQEGLFYTPNAHLGIGLSLLLVGRILYRFIEVGIAGTGGATPSPSPVPTAPTLLLFGMLAGYYVTYAIGLIIWRRRAAKEKLVQRDF